jgi:hypothetical protein
MITREQIVEALERTFEDFSKAGKPLTFTETLNYWTERGCCGERVAETIMRAVAILSGRELAWYYNPMVSEDLDAYPYPIAFVLVDALTQKCLTLGGVNNTPHVTLSIGTVDDAAAAVGYFLSLLGIVVEEELLLQGGDAQ